MNELKRESLAALNELHKTIYTVRMDNNGTR